MEVIEREYKPFFVDIKDLVKRCGVYQLRNIETNKVYIGSSINLADRLKTHFRDLRLNRHDNPKLQHVYNKYGKDKIIYEIIEFCESNLRFEIEQYWINKFFYTELCLNLNPIASHPPNLTGVKRVFSQKHKENLTKSIRERCKDPEYRKRMSEIRIGKHLGAEHANAKAVVCLETGFEYGGIAEASRKSGCSRSGISSCCLKQNKQVDGLHWLYKEDYIKLNRDQIEDYIFINTVGKHVVHLETRKRYAKVIDAQADTGVIRDSIIDCCENRLPETLGGHWVYYDDYLKMTEKDIQDRIKQHTLAFRRCVCLETDEVFESLTAASNKLGVSACKISSVCNGKRRTTGGYHFLYEEDYLKATKQDIEKILNTKGSTFKRCRCIETGETFCSVAEASRKMKLSVTSIFDVCKGNHSAVSGYHFEYIEN